MEKKRLESYTKRQKHIESLQEEIDSFLQIDKFFDLEGRSACENMGRLRRNLLTSNESKVKFFQESLLKNEPIFNPRIEDDFSDLNQINFGSLALNIFWYRSKSSESEEKAIFSKVLELVKAQSTELYDQTKSEKLANAEKRELITMVLFLMNPENEDLKKNAKTVIKKWMKKDGSKFSLFERTIIFYGVFWLDDIKTKTRAEYVNDYGLGILIHLHKTDFFQNHFLKGWAKSNFLKFFEYYAEKLTDHGYYPQLHIEMCHIGKKLESDISEKTREILFLSHQKGIFERLAVPSNILEEARLKLRYASIDFQSIQLETILNECAQFLEKYNGDKLVVNNESLDIILAHTPTLKSVLDKELDPLNEERGSKIWRIFDLVLLAETNFLDGAKLKFGKNYNQILIFLSQTLCIVGIRKLLSVSLENDPHSKNILLRELSTAFFKNTLTPESSILEWAEKKPGQGKAKLIFRSEAEKQEMKANPRLMVMEILMMITDFQDFNYQKVEQNMHTLMMIPCWFIMPNFLHPKFDEFWEKYVKKFKEALTYDAEHRSAFVESMGAKVFFHRKLGPFFSGEMQVAEAKKIQKKYPNSTESQKRKTRKRVKKATNPLESQKETIHPKAGWNAFLQIENAKSMHQKDPEIYWVLTAGGEEIKYTFDAAKGEVVPEKEPNLPDEFADQVLTLQTISSKIIAPTVQIEWKSPKKSVLLEHSFQVDDEKIKPIQNEIRNRNFDQSISAGNLVGFPENLEVVLCVRKGGEVKTFSRNEMINFADFEWVGAQNELEFYFLPKKLKSFEKNLAGARVVSVKFWVNRAEEKRSPKPSAPATPVVQAVQQKVAAAAKKIEMPEYKDAEIFMQFLDGKYEMEIKENEIAFIILPQKERILVRKEGEKWEVDSTLVQDPDFAETLLEVAKEKWGEWKKEQTRQQEAAEKNKANQKDLIQLQKLKNKFNLEGTLQRFAQNSGQIRPAQLFDKDGKLIFGAAEVESLKDKFKSVGIGIQSLGGLKFGISAAGISLEMEWNANRRCVLASPKNPNEAQRWLKRFFELGVYDMLKLAEKIAQNKAEIEEEPPTPEQRALIISAAKAIKNGNFRVPMRDQDGQMIGWRRNTGAEAAAEDTEVLMRSGYLMIYSVQKEEKTSSTDLEMLHNFLMIPRNLKYLIRRILNSVQAEPKDSGSCSPIPAENFVKMAERLIGAHLNISLETLKDPSTTAEFIRSLDPGTGHSIPVWVEALLQESSSDGIPIILQPEISMTLGEVLQKAAEIEWESSQK